MHSQLDHPGIVKYLGSGIDSTLSKPSTGVTRQRCYIATEYCSGGDLFDVIKSKGGLSERQCKNYFRQLIDALEYMHSKSIAHRDLKVENIMLHADGTIKICDLGLATDKDVV